MLLPVVLFAAAASSPIVPPAWLHERMKRPGLAIVEASWTASKPPAEYNAGHIPGAVHLDTDELENGSPQWRLKALPELHRAIGLLGIGPGTEVVVYGRKTIAAARVWWVLYYAGVREVRLLDGGLGAWTRAGFAQETKPNAATPSLFAPARIRTEALATTDYVRTQRHRVRLADVRSRDEFDGRISGYDYLDRKGRIPGAHHLGNADDSAALYQNRDGTLRSADEIRKLWRERGLPLDGGREIVFYCGSGWRSSLAYLYAVAMGLTRVRNYSDGWSGWSTVYERSPSGAWSQRATGNPVVTARPEQPD